MDERIGVANGLLIWCRWGVSSSFLTSESGATQRIMVLGWHQLSGPLGDP